jgi:hypothetical protein
MNRYFKIVVLIAVLTQLLMGQERAGTQSGQFLKISAIPKAAGMADACVALLSGPSAMAYNPAGIYIPDQVIYRFSGAHTSWFANINHEFAAFTYNSELGTFGINARILYTDDMDVTTPLHPEGTGEKFKTADYALGLSYARKLTDKFTLGLTIKGIQSFLYNSKYDETVFAVDIGTIYELGYNGLKIGMSLANLGNDVKYISEVYNIPTILCFGVCVDAVKIDEHKLTVAFQTTRPSDSNERFCLGVEYWYKDFVALRGGYKLTYGADAADFSENVSAGIGFKVPIEGLNLTADYGFQNYRWLPGVHRFSLEFGF